MNARQWGFLSLGVTEFFYTQNSLSLLQAPVHLKAGAQTIRMAIQKVSLCHE